MINYLDYKSPKDGGNRDLFNEIVNYFRSLFRIRNPNSTYVIRQLPFNEHKVFKDLFPRKSLVDEPEDFLRRKVLVILTQFQDIRFFHRLARLLCGKNIQCGVITDMPLSVEDNVAELLEPFNFCFFFDQYHLSKYPYAKIAAERAIEMARDKDQAVYPNLAALGYLELRCTEETESLALQALNSGKESYDFCEPITRIARKKGQFMSLIACPRDLEVKAQQATQNAVIVEQNTENIKITRVYWLTIEQFIEEVNQGQ